MCVCEVNASVVVVVADLLGWVVLGGGGVCGVCGMDECYYGSSLRSLQYNVVCLCKEVRGASE